MIDHEFDCILPHIGYVTWCLLFGGVALAILLDVFGIVLRRWDRK